MMLALQEVNPDAFLHNNINGLKVGKVLKVPAEGEVLKLISVTEAIRQVRQQNQSWVALGGNGTRLGRHAQLIKLESSKKSDASGGEAEGEGAKILTTQDQNLLQQATVSEANGSGDEIADLKARLSQVGEALENRAQENEKMQTRLRKMELQVKALRRLLSIENAPLAAQGLSEEQWKELKLVDALTALSVRESKASTLPSSITIESPSSREEASGAISNFPPQMETVSNLMKLAEKDMGEAESALSVFLTSRNLSLLGGSSVLLLVLTIWRMRKRKISRGPVLTEAEQEMDWCGPVEVQSRRTDEVAGEPAAVQIEVYEAIAEADGHLAANQHYEAAKMLKVALRKDPERQDLKLMKLAEVSTSPQQNDEEAHQNLEMASSDHSSALTPLLLTFDEETTELFSSTGELALEVQISDAENGALEVDLSGMDLIEHHISADEVIDKAREKYGEEEMSFELSDFSSSLLKEEEEEAPKRSLEFFSLELETQESNAIGDEVWALKTDADDVEATTPTITDLANMDAIKDGGAEEIKASFPGKALMDDLDEMEIKLDLARAYIDMDDTEGACSILEEVIAAGNEEQRGAGQDLLIKLAKVS
jgi:pilus assembly protein FimV